MNKLFVLIIILSLKTFGQEEEYAFEKIAKKNRYLSYLLIPDSATKASLFNLSYQYLSVQKNKPFRRGGASFNIGINLARFFTKSIILGLSIETRFVFEGFTKQYFSTEFVKDFNDNYISQYSNYKDSLRASILNEGINSSNGTFIRGSFPGYYGITFSPFPNKWGGILLEVKKGSPVFSFFGKYDGTVLDPNKDNAPVDLILADNLSVDLSFRPYKFSRSRIRNPFDCEKVIDYFNFLIVTLYYERFSLVGAKFNYQDLNTMVNQKFITKYSNQNYFGVKVGLCIY